MGYNFAQDLKSIREILKLTQTELAAQIGVEQVTISRNELGLTKPSTRLLEKVYEFAFEKKNRLNRLKEMLWREQIKNNHKLLFHGAKDAIEGTLNVHTRNCDYIIAPIADNRMFQIINSFIGGEITDEQCKHCLAATNLGSQYVFISNQSISHVKLMERCYISGNEKLYYKNIRSSDAKLGDDKVKLARIQYRGKGRYIDEILN